MCDSFKVYIKIINCCFVIATCRYVHRSRVDVVAFRFVGSIIEGVDVALLPLLIITIREIPDKKQLFVWIDYFHYSTRSNFFGVHLETPIFLTWQHISHFMKSDTHFTTPILYVIALVNGQFI